MEAIERYLHSSLKTRLRALEQREHNKMMEYLVQKIPKSSRPSKHRMRDIIIIEVK